MHLYSHMPFAEMCAMLEPDVCALDSSFGKVVVPSCLLLSLCAPSWLPAYGTLFSGVGVHGGKLRCAPAKGGALLIEAYVVLPVFSVAAPARRGAR